MAENNRNLFNFMQSEVISDFSYMDQWRAEIRRRRRELAARIALGAAGLLIGFLVGQAI